jgi:hypothetical protein
MRFGVLLCLGLAACAPAPSLEGAKLDYDDRARTCHAAHPFEQLAESERRLAPGEAAYRACLHQAAEAALMPALPIDSRDGLRDLLAEDRRLESELAAGRITRGERQAALEDATAKLAQRWRREAELDRRTRAEAAQMDALQRQLSIVDDLVRRGRR